MYTDGESRRTTQNIKNVGVHRLFFEHFFDDIIENDTDYYSASDISEIGTLIIYIEDKIYFFLPLVLRLNLVVMVIFVWGVS
jgi:hypothetical protein